MRPIGEADRAMAQYASLLHPTETLSKHRGDERSAIRRSPAAWRDTLRCAPAVRPISSQQFAGLLAGCRLEHRLRCSPALEEPPAGSRELALRSGEERDHEGRSQSHRLPEQRAAP